MREQGASLTSGDQITEPGLDANAPTCAPESAARESKSGLRQNTKIWNCAVGFSGGKVGNASRHAAAPTNLVPCVARMLGVGVRPSEMWLFEASTPWLDAEWMALRGAQ